MRGVVALLLLAVALLSCPASASNVVQLNDDNFEEEVGKVALMLVKFYAPWCGHCQHMSAAFEEDAFLAKLAHVDPDPAKSWELRVVRRLVFGHKFWTISYVFLAVSRVFSALHRWPLGKLDALPAGMEWKRSHPVPSTPHAPWSTLYLVPMLIWR